MVWRQEDTRLDDYKVADRSLLHQARTVIVFPTSISEIARLGHILFVIVHPYPASTNRVYAGTNLWAVDDKGHVLWKAPNLNSRELEDDTYRGIAVYDADAPKVRVGQWDDRAFTVLNAFTGQPLPEQRKLDWNEVARTLITKGVCVLAALPHAPPEKSQLPGILLTDTARKLIGRGPASAAELAKEEAEWAATRQTALNEGRVWFGYPKKLV